MSGAPWVLRSLLFFPGNRPDMIAKAGRYGADALILDLEDGVAPDEKARARQVVAGALDAGVPGSPIVFLRVNGSGSGLLAWDLREAFRPGAAALCLPKCETPEAVLTLDASLQALESQHRLPRGGIRILPMIESARGVVQAAAIAGSHARVCGLAFGAEDYTADLGVARTRQGAELAYPRAAVSVAARAAGVDAVTGSTRTFGMPMGCARTRGRRARSGSPPVPLLAGSGTDAPPEVGEASGGAEPPRGAAHVRAPPVRRQARRGMPRKPAAPDEVEGADHDPPAHQRNARPHVEGLT